MEPKQKVYLSKTISGIQGLFTNGILVASLTPGEANAASAEAVAKKLGLEYDPQPPLQNAR